jgi:hypothetical protein
MKSHRFRFPILVVALTLSIPAACGSTPLVDPSTRNPPPATGPQGGGDGGAAVDASPPAGMVAEASVDLRVGVSVVAVAEPGQSAATARVFFGLKAVERESGAPVLGAAVTGGPIGRPFALTADPTDPGSYDYAGDESADGGEVGLAGYARDWEFTITRDREILWHVVLAGPSFHSVTATIAGGGGSGDRGAIVSWSPAGEAGVSTEVCAIQERSPLGYSPSPGWCASSPDDRGSLLLAHQTQGPPTVFPMLGEVYQVSVGRTANVALGPGGSGGAVTIGLTVRLLVPFPW